MKRCAHFSSASRRFKSPPGHFRHLSQDLTVGSQYVSLQRQFGSRGSLLILGILHCFWSRKPNSLAPPPIHDKSLSRVAGEGEELSVQYGGEVTIRWTPPSSIHDRSRASPSCRVCSVLSNGAGHGSVRKYALSESNLLMAPRSLSAKSVSAFPGSTN